jgi:hypothetical protein
MDVLRIGNDLIQVDGLMVYKPKGESSWFACNNKRIGTIRLQALYLYLHSEDKARQKRFNTYVDKVINKLIDN